MTPDEERDAEYAARAKREAEFDAAWAAAPGHATDHLTEVAPGVWVDPEIHEPVSGLEGVEGTLEFTATWGGYQCTGVQLMSDRETPITSEILRAIPIGRIAGDVLRREAMSLDPGDDLPLVNPTVGGQIPANLLRTWPKGNTDPLLSRVAFIYQLAIALGEYPTSAVQKATGKSRATASRMVAAARAQGFIRTNEGNDDGTASA